MLIFYGNLTPKQISSIEGWGGSLLSGGGVAIVVHCCLGGVGIIEGWGGIIVVWGGGVIVVREGGGSLWGAGFHLISSHLISSHLI